MAGHPATSSSRARPPRRGGKNPRWRRPPLGAILNATARGAAYRPASSPRGSARGLDSSRACAPIRDPGGDAGIKARLRGCPRVDCAGMVDEDEEEAQ